MLNKTFNEYELRLKKEVAFFKNLISSENFLNGHFKLNGYLTTNKVDIAIDLYELEYHANNDYYIYGDLIMIMIVRFKKFGISLMKKYGDMLILQYQKKVWI